MGVYGLYGNNPLTNISESVQAQLFMQVLEQLPHESGCSIPEQIVLSHSVFWSPQYATTSNDIVNSVKSTLITKGPSSHCHGRLLFHHDQLPEFTGP